MQAFISACTISSISRPSASVCFLDHPGCILPRPVVPLCQRPGRKAALRASSADTFTPRDKTWDILVVGAGPGGLASALELDRVLNGAGSGGLRQSRITVVDPLDPITQFDSGKGFAYSITENGYRLLDRHPAVLELLTERGVEGGVSEVRIFEPDGANSTSKIVRRTPGQRANWYTARNELIEILDDGLRDAQVAGRVSIRSGWVLDRLEREPGAVRATIRNRLTGEAIEMQPRLVVGSDGMGSLVRKSLHDWAAEDGAPAHRNPFSMRVFHSVSGWLRFKVLPLNNNFRLRAPAAVQAGAAVGAPAAPEPASEHVVASEPFYTIKSAQENPAQTEAMSLALSPSSPATAFRPLLIGKTDDHRIWRDPALQSAEGLRAWFAELFPQVDWDSAVAPDAWARFVDARGGRFAHPQVTRGAAAMLVPPAAGGAGAAVLLLGDSLKAAPPNLGTGVNSAFREATLLADHIEARVERGAGDSEAAAALNAAVDSYGREARAEAAAMVRLAQAGTGWPGLARLQRKQRPWLTQALQLLHVANIRWRFKLAKLPLVGERIFFPQLVMMMHRTGPPYNLSYRSILRKVDRTTLAIRVGLVGVFSGVASLLVLAGKFVAAWVGVAM